MHWVAFETVQDTDVVPPAMTDVGDAVTETVGGIQLQVLPGAGTKLPSSQAKLPVPVRPLDTLFADAG